MKKKKVNQFMIGSLLVASSVLMVACTDEGVNKTSKEEGKNETIVEKLQLTQDELSKAKLQQENRMVLLEHFANTALSSNIYYVSIDNLSNESEHIPSTATNSYDKNLQVVLLNNSIDELNKIIANQLTEKEIKLVEKLIDIKKLEIELTEILFKAVEAGNFEKYVFNEELKTEYENKRNLLVAFLLDSEKDISDSAYLYHYPEINKENIEEHIQFMNLIQGLTDDKTTNALKDNMDYILFEVGVSTDIGDVNKERISELLVEIEKAQNNAKTSDYYKENKYYKEFVDKYLEFNVQELKQSLESDNIVDIYKKAQLIYSSLFSQVDEQHSYTYLYITSYYYELKQAEIDAKKKEESKEQKLKEESKKEEIVNENKEDSTVDTDTSSEDKKE